MFFATARVLYRPTVSSGDTTPEVGQTLSIVDTANHEAVKAVPLALDENSRSAHAVVSPDGAGIFADGATPREKFK